MPIKNNSNRLKFLRVLRLQVFNLSQFLFIEATVGSNISKCTSLIKYDLRTDPEGSICPCSVAGCGAVDSAMNGDCIILKCTSHLPLFRPLYLIGYYELGHIGSV